MGYVWFLMPFTRPDTFQTNKRHEMNYMRILVWYDKLVIVLVQSSNDMKGKHLYQIWSYDIVLWLEQCLLNTSVGVVTACLL